MANATTMVGFRAAILDTTGASQSLALDPGKIYSLRHYGKDAAGADDVNEIKIEMSKEDGTDADAAVAVRTSDTDTIIMKSNDVFTTVIGVRQIKYIRFAGAPQLHVVEASREMGKGVTL
jgi:hypothetical protein